MAPLEVVTPPARSRPAITMVPPRARRAALDHAATLSRLGGLIGRDVVVQLRPGGPGDQIRITTRGVLLGPPVARLGVIWALGGHEAPADAVILDSGAWLTVPEDGFLHGEWWAGGDATVLWAPPRLTITSADSVVHVTVIDGADRASGGRWPDDVDDGDAA
ncbi:MAG: hypothetical protein JHC74_09180 [Thermoleophilia bacterium]|nr:hypothetical protein [Thermoleophilia bacterium]